MKKFFVNSSIVLLTAVLLAGCVTAGEGGYYASMPAVQRPVVVAPAPIVLPPMAVSYNQFSHGRAVSVNVGNGYGLPIYDGYQRQMMMDQLNFQRQQQLNRQNYQRQQQLDRQNFQRQMQIDAMNRLRQQQQCHRR